MAKTSLDLFTLGLKQVWSFSVLGERIYEVKKGQDEPERIKTGR